MAKSNLDNPKVKITSGERTGNYLIDRRVQVTEDSMRRPEFKENYYPLGSWSTLKDICTQGAVVTIRILGREEGHARAKVKILETKQQGDELAAKMEFVEIVPIP